MVMLSRGAGGAVTVRAVALVGFYRGHELVQPGDILELPRDEFSMHKSFNQVDYAPEPPTPKPVVKGATK